MLDDENSDSTEKIPTTSSQHLRDFKLAIEFKHLMQHAPSGVYLIPELKNIRRLHGVIFIRKGLYRDGVFRFTMILPELYNSMNSHPEIFFTLPVYNPLIHPETGKLDLIQDENLKVWNPEKHFILTALTFLKKIFYLKQYDSFKFVSNEDARNLFNSNKNQYIENVQSFVRQSIDSVHDDQHKLCTLIFTEPKPAHELVRENLLANNNNTNDNNNENDNFKSCYHDVDDFNNDDENGNNDNNLIL